jgi:hypothetical protein
LHLSDSSSLALNVFTLSTELSIFKPKVNRVEVTSTAVDQTSASSQVSLLKEVLKFSSREDGVSDLSVNLFNKVLKVLRVDILKANNTLEGAVLLFK